MYVCVCNAVTERQIAEAAQNGMTRLRHLRDALGVTADCGRCAKCAHQCLRDALAASGSLPAAGTLQTHIYDHSLAMEAA